MATKRMENIDIIRGIGILATIYVHTSLIYEYPNLTKYFQAVHLFLFFFVSGFFFKREKLGESINKTLIKQAKQLLIPYLVFSIINTILNAFLGASFKNLVINLYQAHLIFGSIWFLTAQFICYMTANILMRKIERDSMVLAVSVLLMFVFWCVSKTDYRYLSYFRYQQGLFGVFFFVSGYLFRKHHGISNSQYGVLIGLGLLLIGGILIFLNDTVHLSRLELGIFPLTAMGGLCTIAGIFLVLNKVRIGKNPIFWYLAFLGRNSLTVFCTHYYILYIMDKVFPRALSGISITEETWLAVLLSMLIQTVLIFVWQYIKPKMNRVVLLIKQ